MRPVTSFFACLLGLRDRVRQTVAESVPTEIGAAGTVLKEYAPQEAAALARDIEAHGGQWTADAIRREAARIPNEGVTSREGTVAPTQARSLVLMAYCRATEPTPRRMRPNERRSCQV